jgi:carbamoyl-phosphate synthase large subunit
LPTYNISEEHLGEIRKITKTLALSLEVVGLINIQFAIAEGKLYVLEVNPRASRTVPFLAKATGLPLAKIATRLMMGNSLKSMGLSADLEVDRFYVKTPVFPFAKFPGSDPIASVEMRSTGEVMGSADSMGMAFFKAQLAAGISLPKAGKALITVNDRDHDNVVPIAKRLSDAGFMLCATRGTALTLRASNLRVEEVQKHGEGEPDCVDAIRQGEIDLIINTPLGGESHRDGVALRQMALEKEVPFITTLSGAEAAVDAIEALKRGETFEVVCLQELHHG